ncbi:homoserine O-acetyltransferase [Aquibacillus halophilus]|uniref:Homoserine O-acetyltransferase n=1 Tax=Aquibacillus halophilus TaxID=930132 RepID=A0A6A8D9R1_9BACI|nr:homoserine O-acetyltransferase [Aquibacillus halophilus]MRH42020.1 homoserine O-acetyltransferase [Aquibacillus halophilus]
MKVQVASLRETGTINIGDLQLESGKILYDTELAYERIGSIDDPAILICHALTGSQYAVGDDDNPGYWSNLIKSDGYINTDNYQIISFNVIGGCNGSTGPLSINPNTGTTYQTDFPFITVRDMVKAQYQGLQKFNIDHLHAVAGGSLGGMQVLEWGILYPKMMDMLFPIAVTPYLIDYAIAFNNIARLAILQDPKWNNGNYSQDAIPEHGLSLARMVGMITYRSGDLFNDRFGREQKAPAGVAHEEIAYEVESYLDYQGKKLTKRFDANSYLYLLKAMDTHDIGRERGGWEKAAELIQAPLHAISYSGDLLFPPNELNKFVNHAQKIGKTASFEQVETRFGHDGFLVEFEKWGNILQENLRKIKSYQY